jgi:hypothetical protein
VDSRGEVSGKAVVREVKKLEVFQRRKVQIESRGEVVLF